MLKLILNFINRDRKTQIQFTVWLVLFVYDIIILMGLDSFQEYNLFYGIFVVTLISLNISFFVQFHIFNFLYMVLEDYLSYMNGVFKFHKKFEFIIRLVAGIIFLAVFGFVVFLAFYYGLFIFYLIK